MLKSEHADDVSPQVTWIVVKAVPATFRPRVPDSVGMLLDVESRNNLLARRLSVECGRAESASDKLIIRWLQVRVLPALL